MKYYSYCYLSKLISEAAAELEELGELEADFLPSFQDAVTDFIEAVKIEHQVKDVHSTYDVVRWIHDSHETWEMPPAVEEKFRTLVQMFEEFGNNNLKVKKLFPELYGAIDDFSEQLTTAA